MLLLHFFSRISIASAQQHSIPFDSGWTYNFPFFIYLKNALQKRFNTGEVGIKCPKSWFSFSFYGILREKFSLIDLSFQFNDNDGGGIFIEILQPEQHSFLLLRRCLLRLLVSRHFNFNLISLRMFHAKVFTSKMMFATISWCSCEINIVKKTRIRNINICFSIDMQQRSALISPEYGKNTNRPACAENVKLLHFTEADCVFFSLHFLTLFFSFSSNTIIIQWINNGWCNKNSRWELQMKHACTK